MGFAAESENKFVNSAKISSVQASNIGKKEQFQAVDKMAYNQAGLRPNVDHVRDMKLQSKVENVNKLRK